ncbi:MAG: UPF0147 family protein [Nitrososphaerales archaeon]
MEKVAIEWLKTSEIKGYTPFGDANQMSTAAERREKKRIENEEKVQKALATLSQVSDSNITPRNIRKIVKDAINMLGDSKISIGVRAANSISILEEVSQDPNMPSFSRVTIWSAVSTLESVRES